MANSPRKPHSTRLFPRMLGTVLASTLVSSIALMHCDPPKDDSNNQNSSGGANDRDASDDIVNNSTPLEQPDAGARPTVSEVVDAGPPPVSVEPPPVAPPPAPRISEQAAAQINTGLRAVAEGNLAAAQAAFEQAVSTDSRAYIAIFNAGVVADRQGNDARAKTLYEQCINTSPNFSAGYLALAQLYLRTPSMGSLDSLLARMGSTLQQTTYRDDFDLRAAYARVLVLKGNYSEAISQAQQVLIKQEKHVRAILAIAEAQRAQQRTVLARSIIEQLVLGSSPAAAVTEQNPCEGTGPGANDPQVHYARALIRLEQDHDVPHAIESLRCVLKLDPAHTEAHNNLGVFLLQTGNYEEAISHLSLASKLAPTWAKAHLNLGDALRATRQYDDAIRELTRAQQLDGTLTQAHFNFGKLYFEQALQIALSTDSGVEALQNRKDLLTKSKDAYTRFRDSLLASDPVRRDLDATLRELDDKLARNDRVLQTAIRRRERDARAADAGTSSSSSSSSSSSDAGTNG